MAILFELMRKLVRAFVFLKKFEFCAPLKTKNILDPALRELALRIAPVALDVGDIRRLAKQQAEYRNGLVRHAFGSALKSICKVLFFDVCYVSKQNKKLMIFIRANFFLGICAVDCSVGNASSKNYRFRNDVGDAVVVVLVVATRITHRCTATSFEIRRHTSQRCCIRY